MLILDKQKAVERVVALTSGAAEAVVEPPAASSHTRTYQRVATYERRAQVLATPLGRERRRRPMRRAADSLSL